MDTSELNVDVQPTYVRVTIREKILQLVLDEEVKVDESNAKRLIGSKLLEVTMPKVGYCISQRNWENKSSGKNIKNASTSSLCN